MRVPLFISLLLALNLVRQWWMNSSSNNNKGNTNENPVSVQQQSNEPQLLLRKSGIVSGSSDLELSYVHSKPGMVFSHDRLIFNPEQGVSTILYWFHLSKTPTHNVTVLIHDPSGCTTQVTKRPILKVVISPDVAFQPVHVRAAILKPTDECEQGLIHALRSRDQEYDGLHIRIFIDVVSAAKNEIVAGEDGDERTGEWIPEEVLGAEEGPARALAPIERSRSAFNFANSLFRCRNHPMMISASSSSRPHKRLVCFLGAGTLYETPFYVIDPVGGLDEDGWNGFPVVLLTGGMHGSEPAGSAAAQVVASSWIPRRGRFVVVPFVNMRGLRQGTRSIPGVSSSRLSDLNRNFPPDGNPLGDLATEVWRLASAIRPDMHFDFHEGWGVFSQLKDNVHDRLVNSKTFSKGSSVISTVDAVPIAERMIVEVNRNLASDRLFELIVQPIAGGLAAKLGSSFHTRAVVMETTKDQALDVRVRQHLVMLHAALVATDVVLENGVGNMQATTITAGGRSGSSSSSTSNTHCMPIPVSDLKSKDAELCL